jgi:hypothetical protein
LPGLTRHSKLRQLKKIGGNTLLLHRLTRDSLFYFVIAFGINLGGLRSA